MSKTRTPEPRPSTPSRLRICKKLVVKGHASSTGASYTLFLKVQLPISDREEEYTLMKDPNIELQDAIVHRLDASGAAPALSTSAATAASSLGIPLSIDHEMNDSLIDFKPQQKGAGLNEQLSLPLVVRHHQGNIVLRSSVSPHSKHANAPHHSSASYMVKLNLFTAPASKPPYAPFSVRLAVPSCLNNFMRFTVDESISEDFGLPDLAVEVDPPILPVSSQRRTKRPRSSAASSQTPSVMSLSDDQADVTLLASEQVDNSDFEQDDSAIVGPFQACEAIVIRLASERSGDLALHGSSYGTLSNALRAKEASSSIKYHPRQSRASPASREAGAEDPQGANTTEVDFEATLQLQDPFFLGLDREVLLYLQLDPQASIQEWKPTSIDASRGILSWSFGPVSSSSSSTSPQPKTTTRDSKSPTSENGDLVVLPEPSQQTTDDDDLLNEAPPKGIDADDFDFSLDNATAPSTKQRRFSLQSSSSMKRLPSPISSEPPDVPGTSSSMLMVAFALLPVLQSSEPVVITVRGTITLHRTLSATLTSQDLAQLPKGLCAPAALSNLYFGPSAASLGSVSAQLQAPEQSLESLRASQETVLQSQVNKGLAAEGLNALGNAKTDDILRQALAIINAHNSSLSDGKPSDLAVQAHRGRQGTASDFILRSSHLLWTLFLTAMMVMLFNASQTANRALSAKVDELARIIEASAMSHSQTFPLAFDPTHPTSTSEPAIPTASIVQPRQDDSRLDTNDLLDVHDASQADTIHQESDSVAESEEHLDRLAWRDHLAADSTDLQPGSADTEMTFTVTNWLRDLFRMPVLFLRRLLSFFTPA